MSLSWKFNALAADLLAANLLKIPQEMPTYLNSSTISARRPDNVMPPEVVIRFQPQCSSENLFIEENAQLLCTRRLYIDSSENMEVSLFFSEPSCRIRTPKGLVGAHSVAVSSSDVNCENIDIDEYGAAILLSAVRLFLTHPEIPETPLSPEDPTVRIIYDKLVEENLAYGGRSIFGLGPRYNSRFTTNDSYSLTRGRHYERRLEELSSKNKTVWPYEIGEILATDYYNFGRNYEMMHNYLKQLPESEQLKCFNHFRMELGYDFPEWQTYEDILYRFPIQEIAHRKVLERRSITTRLYYEAIFISLLYTPYNKACIEYFQKLISEDPDNADDYQWEIRQYQRNIEGLRKALRRPLASRLL